MHKRYGTAFDAEDLSPARIDLEMAGAFLNALELKGRFSFQTFGDAKGSPRRLVRQLHGPASLEMLMHLAELNQQGAGIFVTVNRTDGKGRKATNIVGVRALFIDGDNLPQPVWHQRPDLVVRRDALHWHAYWLCSGMALDEFCASQKRLIRHYKTDPAVFDLSRVMRVPGFLHQKAAPCLVHFEDIRHANSVADSGRVA
jgi:putative DNA primase/helicase